MNQDDHIDLGILILIAGVSLLIAVMGVVLR